MSSLAKIFKISSMYFGYKYFVIISPWKRAWPFIWNFNHHHPKMPFARCCWNWPIGSGDENFKILSKYLSYFLIIFPWKGCDSPFQQTLIIILVTQGGAKFRWIWPIGSGEDFQNSSVYIFASSLSSPLGYKCGPSFELESPSPKDALCQVWMKLT